MRQAYYHELQQDPEFGSSLEALRATKGHGRAAAIKAFVERWHLPSKYESELRACLTEFPDGTFLGLHAMSTRLPGIPSWYSPDEDPVLRGGKQDELLDRLVENNREDLIPKLEDARVQVKRLGWQPAGPWATEVHAEKVARRLYERCVLRKSWSEIARQEHPEPDPHAVLVSVLSWARALTIALPRKAGK